MKRRHFLQFASSALATLGISQLEIQQKGLQYAKVLAQNTPRKVALLVGIDKYPTNSGYRELKGCVTDVYLQRELLIYRFGFNKDDIHIITNQQATRQGILDAFEKYLITPVKPGDVAVFHYSGHGDRVIDPDRDHEDGFNSTLVPVNSVLPKDREKGGEVIDITGHSLFLMMKAVNTENMTVILDSCHSGGATRGNMRVRYGDGGTKLRMSQQEIKWQEKWLSDNNYSKDDFIRDRRKGVSRGVVIAGAKRNQETLDASFEGFDAGLFTYVLTQYIWQQTGEQPLNSLIPTITQTTLKRRSVQEPYHEIKPETDNDRQPLYFLPSSLPPAEGVISKVENKQAEIWLGGISSESINSFQTGSIFTLIDENNQELGKIQLESREGLKGKAKLLEGSNTALKPGIFLQEEARSFPSDLKLTIGLDPSLGNEATDAQKMLEKLSRIASKPLFEGEVDYILGRMTESIYQEKSQKPTDQPLPPVGAIGLFSASGEPIANSFDAVGESVTQAVDRLKTKFQSLLAVKIVKTTFSVDSSKLNLTVSMRPEGQDDQLLATITPTRGGVGRDNTGQPQQPSSPITDISRLPLKTPIQFLVTNKEAENLYLSIIIIDSEGEMVPIFPNDWSGTEDTTKLAAGQTMLIPDPSKDKFIVNTKEPKGIVEALIIASKTPLTEALKKLQKLASEQNKEGTRSFVELSNPVEVMDSLLTDLDEGTRSRGGGWVQERPPGTRSIAVTQFATMSITFEVI